MPLVDKQDTQLEEKAWLNQATIRLYDPPVDGKTPADGAGKPSTSSCYLRDKEAQLAAGFTTEVVGWDEKWQKLGESYVAPGTMFEPLDETPEEPAKIVTPRKAPEKKPRLSVVKRSTNRTRTIKR